MTNNKIYQEPEVKVVNLCFEGSVLVGSVQTGGNASGEDFLLKGLKNERF